MAGGTVAILRHLRTLPHNPMECERVQSPTSDLNSLNDTDPTLTGLDALSSNMAEGPASPWSCQDGTGDDDSDLQRSTMYVGVDAVLPEINPADLCKERAAADVVFHEPLGNRSTPLKPSAPNVPKTVERPACVQRRHFVSPEGGGVC